MRKTTGGVHRIPPKRDLPPHPGEILAREFMRPLGLKQVHLAGKLGVSAQRINEVVKGKHRLKPDMAWRLAGAFGTSPQFWMNLQVNHDLAVSRPGRLAGRIPR